MTALQPNAFAAGLRKALDIVKDRRDLVIRLNDLGEDATIKGWTGGSLFQLNQLIDTLSDQLLDAGGFLGDEPEPEDDDLTAFVMNAHGEVMAHYLLKDSDPLEPDHYAEIYATMAGFELDTDCGLIPDGCEDFSVKIASAPDDIRCWNSCNYMMKGE